MLMIEVRPPFQWKPSYVHFGDIRRWMWGFVAISICPYGINELFEGIAAAGVALDRERVSSHSSTHQGSPE